MSDPILVSTLARSVEAIDTAQKIKAKVETDDREGWYTPVQIGKTALDVSPAYVRNGLKMLKKSFGLEFAGFMVGLTESNLATYNKWIRGSEQPNSFLSHRIRNVIEVAEILLAVRSPEDAKAWLMSPCSYLDPTLMTLPVDEIRTDPDSVRRAALYLFK